MSVLIGGPDPRLLFGDGTVQKTAGVPNNGAAFRVSRVSPQTLISGIRAGLLFDAKNFDLTNSFDLTASSFTAPVTGLYSITVKGNITTTAGGVLDLATVGYSSKGVFGPEGSLNYPLTTVSTIYSIITDTILLAQGETANATARALGTGDITISEFSFSGHLVRAL